MRTTSLIVAAVLAVCLFAGPAARADVRPKILIVFDTSGSMLNGGADGSELCSGNNKSSRIYQLKAALFEVLQGIGALEVDFALSTFPMLVDPKRTPKCVTSCTDSSTNYKCSGHYYVIKPQDSIYTSSKHACKISTHNPNSQTNGNCGASSNPCAAWYGNFKNEVLKVPFGSAPEDVMIYFDQKEDTGPVASGPLTNPEIRAAGGWYTPLGKSLFYAHGYFHKDIDPTIPAYEKPCTAKVVALFTDGNETCNNNTSHAFYPTKWAASLNSNLGVITHTVAIDLSSNLLKSIASSGKGTYYQVGGNTAALKQAFLDIIAKSLPPSEVCNGKDDDCDNKIDEDFPLKGKPCDNGKLGVCFKTGIYVCKSDGSGVVCNAPNANGTPEKCNGLDDDCDGDIDDIPGCIPCVPQPEICNGKDDNCNGQVDEGYVSQKCGKDIGVCKPGNTKCVNGKIICDGGTQGTTEVCNGLDDDCDGTRDGMTGSCYTFSTGCVKDTKTGKWDCTGFCKPGMMTCVATQVSGVWKGVWSSCVGQVGPNKEICNGLDDDCDGDVDEGAECPGGSQCINGACSPPCGTGEFSCPKGQLCKDGWCVKDPCDAETCEGKGWVCKAGECIDPCKNVTCGKFEKCVRGACVDTSCYNPQNRCPSGQICSQGECVPDPCEGIKCASDEFCSSGYCVRMCDTITCNVGEICKVVNQSGKPTAKCVKDKCASQQCGESWVCFNGQCIEDPCKFKNCERGQACEVVDDSGTAKAECVKDPCEGVVCDPRFSCKQGMCVSEDVTGSRELLASGSGGLACAAAPPSTPSSPPLGLVFLLVGLGVILSARRD